MSEPISFFNKQTDRSRVKSDIISKYFSGWLNVMCSSEFKKLVYLDLFCGPGRYEDKNPSTPLLVMDKAINHHHPKACEKIQFIFNDINPLNIEKLRNELSIFPGIEKLHNQPAIYNDEVGEETVKTFEKMVTAPTLSLIDPCGYKGLSLRLIRALVKDWGCDSIFFFNYLRVNPAIENKILEPIVSLLFTEDIFKKLQEKIKGKDPYEREKIIINKIIEVFTDWGMEYVLPFSFKTKTGNRTTHYLIYVTKHPLGYDIMKNIMAKASSYDSHGVPSFACIPVHKKFNMPTLFSPIVELKKMILKDFAETTRSMIDIYNGHSKNKPYIKSNYKRALLELENEKTIKTNRIERNARKGSFPDDMLAIFPKWIKRNDY